MVVFDFRPTVINLFGVLWDILGRAGIANGGKRLALWLTTYTHMSAHSKKRVQFRAPPDLIDRADALAMVLGTDRTDVLIDALREYLRDAAHDDGLKQEIAGAYYDDEIAFEQLRALVGHEEAANFRVLKRQLEDDLTGELADL